MSRKIKKPNINQGRSIKVSEDQLNPEQVIDYPVFCFKHLHNRYDISRCSDDEKIIFIKKLHKLSSMTWNQIKLAPRHGLGTEKIHRSSIKKDMPEFVSDDVEYLLAFRCFGMMPILGHRNGPILHILYIDPNGEVYDH